VKKGEDETVIGGGIAYSGGRLYVTNGFNEILALKPDTGRILWRTETPDTLRGAPSAVPGRVFVSGMNNKTFALDSASGQILWQHSGLTGGTSVLGASTPAIDKDAIITAYTSGEVYALRIENGQELWAENLSPIARAAGQSLLTDIRALPVIDKGAVYSVSNANRMAAIDMRTGLPKWQVSIGSSQTPWVSGNRTYVIGSQSSLIALDNENGDIIWQQALPKYEDPDDREGLMVWSGPILAGNRLLAFSSEGLAIEFNPLDGSIIRRWDTDGDVMLPVAIADETLYIVTENGVVSAWK
jgi:outer membrane protein assembly factor BamB